MNFSRYFYDGKELVAHILEKKNELPDDLGEDFSKAESFHRMHAAFERDISSLGKQVLQTTWYINEVSPSSCFYTYRPLAKIQRFSMLQLEILEIFPYLSSCRLNSSRPLRLGYTPNTQENKPLPFKKPKKRWWMPGRDF